MVWKPKKSIVRFLASCALVASVFLTFDIRRSPSNPEDWSVDVTIASLNIALFCVAGVLFWFSHKLPSIRGGASTDAP